MKSCRPAARTSQSLVQAIDTMRPLPDNVFLITDGLPTRSADEPRRSTVTGRQRWRLFQDATRRLPRGMPINSILLPHRGRPDGVRRLLATEPSNRGHLHVPVGGLAMIRRELEEIGLSFLDVICCGFGAIILLLMIVKTVEPIVLEDPEINLEGVVAQKRDSLA